MKMNVFAAALLIGACFLVLGFSKSPKVKAKDLQQLTGTQWTGTLTYLDYGKNKKVSIPANLIVTTSAADKLSWVFDYQYPDEPKANSKETVTLSRDGKIFDGETVVEKNKLDDGTIKIVTEKAGMDNDKKSQFRFTYLLSRTSFSIKKEVKYDGTNEFFERNQYSWKR